MKVLRTENLWRIRTVNMEKWQKRNSPVLERDVWLLSNLIHPHVAGDIPVAEHDSLGLPSSSGGVRQEHKLVRLGLCPPIPAGPGEIAQASEVLELERRIFAVAQEYDPVLGDSDRLGGLQSDLQQR